MATEVPSIILPLAHVSFPRQCRRDPGSAPGVRDLSPDHPAESDEDLRRARLRNWEEGAKLSVKPPRSNETLSWTFFFGWNRVSTVLSRPEHYGLRSAS